MPVRVSQADVDDVEDCFLQGRNSVQLNQATINRIVSYVLKRYGHVAGDAVVEFKRFDNGVFTFDIDRKEQS